jgi:hypothetical protein
VRVVGLLAAAGFSSCTQWIDTGPAVNDQVIVQRVTACNAAGDTPKAAYDYMQVGFANVYAACEAFFVGATRFQQNALATNQTLDAGLVGATSIINATSSAATAVKAITITAAGIVFGKSIMNDYVTTYTFGTHLYKVRQLVQNDMDNFANRVAAPPDTCLAYANVQKLALKCTLANMQSLLDGQVAIPSQVSDQPVTLPADPPRAMALGGPRVAPAAPRLHASPPMSSRVIAN